MGLFPGMADRWGGGRLRGRVAQSRYTHPGRDTGVPSGLSKSSPQPPPVWRPQFYDRDRRKHVDLEDTAPDLVCYTVIPGIPLLRYTRQFKPGAWRVAAEKQFSHGARPAPEERIVGTTRRANNLRPGCVCDKIIRVFFLAVCFSFKSDLVLNIMKIYTEWRPGLNSSCLQSLPGIFPDPRRPAHRCPKPPTGRRLPPPHRRPQDARVRLWDPRDGPPAVALRPHRRRLQRPTGQLPPQTRPHPQDPVREPIRNPPHTSWSLSDRPSPSTVVARVCREDLGASRGNLSFKSLGLYCVRNYQVYIFRKLNFQPDCVLSQKNGWWGCLQRKLNTKARNFVALLMTDFCSISRTSRPRRFAYAFAFSV